MAQAGYTPISLYFSATAAAVPTSGNLVAGELALNTLDGKLYYKNSAGTVTLLASTSGASGDVVGPASATDNALARFDLTTGKLIQNSVGILSDAGALSGLTDISASGSVTLSGGTANGVTYLNGSKVLTSGSALTFDGSVFGVAPATGVVAKTKQLVLNNFAGEGVGITFSRTNDDTEVNAIGTANSNWDMGLFARENMIFAVGGGSTYSATTEKMRLDSSGNLGLGVTPSAWSGGKAIQVKSSSNPIFISETAGDGWFGYNSYYNGTNWIYVGSYYANALKMADGQFQFMQAASGTTGNAITFTQAMTLDASGNLGIGTTSPLAKLEVYNSSVTAAFVPNTASTWSVAQVRNNGYVTAGNAVGIAFVGRTDVQPAGIAAINSTTGGGATSLAFMYVTGNTTTEGVRIDTSGNLLVGTTSQYASSKLSVNGAGAFNTSGVDGTFTSFINGVYSGNTAQFGSIQHSMSSGAQNSGFRFLGGGAGGGGTTQQKMVDMTRGQHTWYITDSEVARIDSSGNLGIGTSSPVSPLTAARGNVTGAGQWASSAIAVYNPTNTGSYSQISFGYTTGTTNAAAYIGFISTNQGSNGYGDLVFGTRAVNTDTQPTERARIDSSGNFIVGKTSDTFSTDGAIIRAVGSASFTVTNNEVLDLNRLSSDGILQRFFQDSTAEGNISVAGTTVSYNGGHLSRWAQTTTTKDESLVKGTVLSNLDEMNVYTDAEGNTVDNEQLNKVKVSNVEGDVNVAGVFVNWSHDEDHNVDEINMAMTGDMIIRIAQGTTVARGDLLMSAGDGTAMPQGDDIVRSKTIAKVTSNHVTCTYADGSYCVPCVLMAC